MWQNDKLEQLRTLLETLSTCCADKATEAKLEQCRLLLNDILNAIPGAGSGNYALETSMQTSLSRLQSILDAMPEVDALMTEAKGEAIRTLIQSIYDDCCPNAILGDIAADAAAIEQDTAAIAADAAAIEQDTAAIAADAAAIEQDTAAIATDTDLMVFDIDRVRQECETIALQTGNTRVAAENIEAAIPDLQDSLEDLEICCTNQALRLDQIQANTDHLDQMSTDLTQIEADVAAQAADIAAMKTDVAAIRDCACRSPLRQMLEDCCKTETEEGGERKTRSIRDADEGVDYNEDDPAYDPPDGSEDWATYKTGKCAWARYFVWQSGRDFEDLIQLYQTIGDAAFNILSTATVISAVAGGAARASVAIAATRTALMVAKGAAGSTGVGLIAVAVFEALVIAWKAVFDLFIDEVMDVWENIPKCELFRAIYCNTTGAAIKADWDAVIDTYVPAVPYLPLAVVFKLWMSQDTANALLTVGNAAEVPPVLTECACNCMSDWHDPDLAVHTHDDLRSMVLSGNVITQWTNTGAAGGYFAGSGGPTYNDTGKYVYVNANKKLTWAQGGRFEAMYIVVECVGTTNYIIIQDGQDTYKPQVSMNGTSLFLRLQNDGGHSTPIPAGYNVIGMRWDTIAGVVKYTLNGSALGQASLTSSSPGVIPPLALGSIAAQYSATFRVKAVVGWLLYNYLDEDQEDDIITNLTTLYGPFGV